MGSVIRILLTIALLYVVFQNAHWSVGVCLSLMALAIELQTAVIQRRL